MIKVSIIFSLSLLLIITKIQVSTKTRYISYLENKVTRLETMSETYEDIAIELAKKGEK